MSDQGPEPTGWELLRALAALREEVSKIGGRVVPLDVYQADQKGVAERFGRVESRARDLEVNLTAEKNAREAAEKEALEKRAEQAEQIVRARRSTQLSIALAVVGPVAAFILARLPFGGA